MLLMFCKKNEFMKRSYSEVTDEDLVAYRAKHRKVVVIAVSLSDEDESNACFVICAPSRDVLYAVSSYAQKGELAKANRMMIKNCVLAGDLDYLDEDKGDDDVYLAVLEEIGKLTATKKAKLVKR